MKGMKKLIRKLKIICSLLLIGVILVLSLGVEHDKGYSVKSQKLVNDIVVEEKEDDNYIYLSKGIIKALQDAFNNKDVIGYIDSDDMKLHYPIVESVDNDDYLHRDLSGNYSISGTIFLDKDCETDFSSINSVLYGHHMINGSMFGGIERKTNELGLESQKFYIYTEKGRYEYTGIAKMVIEPTEEIARHLITSRTRGDFLNWVAITSSEMSYKPIGSVKNASNSINYSRDIKEAKFVTLITCHYIYNNVVRFGLVCECTDFKEYKFMKSEEDN